MSRLWGEWETRFYGSGTTNVSLVEYAHKPWLSVHADSSEDGDRYQRDRYAMCEQLCAFMNGGPRPVWLDDFDRESGEGEEDAYALSGASIAACGPMVDVDPPKLNWRRDESKQAKMDRALLMDVVFKKS